MVLSFMILIISLSAFGQKVESRKYGRMLNRRLPKNVPSVEVKEVDTTNEAIVFVDAREREEFNVSHIKNAYFVGYKELNLQEVLNLPKSTEIIVYCSVGYRSGKVTKRLVKEGFVNVKNLYGGLFEWSNQQMPLVDSNGDSTKKIHPFNEKWGRWITHGEKAYQ
jgi:rhodanese-related sulfurtransferase